MAQALAVASDTNSDLLSPLAHLFAELATNEAVNAYRAERWNDAIMCYLRSAAGFNAVQMPDSALHALRGAANVACYRADQSAFIPLIDEICRPAGSIVVYGSSRVSDGLQEIWDAIFNSFFKHVYRLGGLVLAMQGAKGNNFAAILGQRTYDWRRDYEASALLTAIKTTHVSNLETTSNELGQDPRFGDSVFLTS